MDTAILITQWILDKLTLLINLFSGAEWKAMAWVVGGTLGGTHVIKKLWRASPIPGGGNRQIEALSAIVSFTVAFKVWPQDSAPWWIGAIVGAGISAGLFKAAFTLLKHYKPDLAATVNLDRRKTVNGLPPEGRSERRK